MYLNIGNVLPYYPGYIYILLFRFKLLKYFYTHIFKAQI